MGIVLIEAAGQMGGEVTEQLQATKTNLLAKIQESTSLNPDLLTQSADQTRHLNLALTAIGHIHTAAQILIDTGYGELNDDDMDALIGQIGNRDFVTIPQITSVLAPRIADDFSQAKHIYEDAALSETDDETVIFARNRMKNARKAGDALSQIGQAMTTLVDDVRGELLPSHFGEILLEEIWPWDEAEETKGGIPMGRLGKLVHASGGEIAQLIRDGVLIENDDFAVTSVKGKLTYRKFSPAGVEKVTNYFADRRAKRSFKRIQELPVDIESEDNQEHSFLKMLPLVLERNENGRFSYMNQVDIVRARFPENSDDTTESLLYGRLTKGKNRLGIRLRQVTEGMSGATVQQAVDIASQTAWDYWVKPYKEIGDQYGDMTVDEFVTGVLNRFDRSLPFEWYRLDDILMGVDKEVTEQAVMKSFRQGSEYRQTPRGFQVSEGTGDIISRVHATQPQNQEDLLEAIKREKTIQEEKDNEPIFRPDATNEAMKKIFERDQNGRFTHHSQIEIAYAMLKDDQKELSGNKQAAEVRLTNVKYSLLVALRGHDTDPPQMVADIIDGFSYRQRSSPIGTIYDSIKNQWGTMTVDEFSIGVLNRFGRGIPEGWVGVNQEAEQMLIDHFRLGRDYRQTPYGFQASERTLEVLERGYTNPTKLKNTQAAFDEAKDFLDRIDTELEKTPNSTWDGNRLLVAFLRTLDIPNKINDDSTVSGKLKQFFKDKSVPLSKVYLELGSDEDRIINEWIIFALAEDAKKEGTPKERCKAEFTFEMGKNALPEVQKFFNGLTHKYEYVRNAYLKHVNPEMYGYVLLSVFFEERCRSDRNHLDYNRAQLTERFEQFRKQYYGSHNTR